MQDTAFISALKAAVDEGPTEHVLPFIRHAPDEPRTDSKSFGFDIWHVASTGDWDADLLTGWHYAELAVKYGRAISDSGFVSLVLAAIMMKSGEGTQTAGVDFGFFLRVSTLSHVGTLS